MGELVPDKDTTSRIVEQLVTNSICFGLTCLVDNNLPIGTYGSSGWNSIHPYDGKDIDSPDRISPTCFEIYEIGSNHQQEVSQNGDTS